MKKLAFLLFTGSLFGQALPFTPFTGFGANATGGSNIVHVTNLNSTGAGSYNACVIVSGNRCVFDVGGTIIANQIFPAANTTTDGFSAPSVITLTGGAGNGGACLQIQNSNVIVQGIRVRNCTSIDNLKGILIYDGGSQGSTLHDIVIDHNEVENTTDQNLTAGSGHGITFSWNITANNNQSGCILQAHFAYNVTYSHNLIYNCSAQDSRMPLVSMGEGDGVTSGGPHTFLNQGTSADIEWNIASLYFFYGFIATDDQNTEDDGNYVGNYIDEQTGSHPHNAIDIMANTHTHYYLAGNAAVHSNVLFCPAPYFVSSPNNPFCMTKTNTLDCTRKSDGNGNGLATGFAAGSCQPSTPFSAPAVATINNPCVTDNTSRIAEWNAVKAGAGVVSKFADDATTTAVRNGVTTPTTTILNQSWNSQTGNCNSITPPAPASHLFAVLR